MIKKVKKTYPIVTIVDKNDKAIGKATYEEMTKHKLIYRGASTFVFNKKGQLLVHQRASWFKNYPNAWDFKVGGIVDSGETYKHCALRELKEEFGIKILPHKLKLVNKEKIFDKKSHCYRKLYTCQYIGKIKVDQHEVQNYKFIDYDKVMTLTKKNHSPSGLRVFRYFQKWKK